MNKRSGEVEGRIYPSYTQWYAEHEPTGGEFIADFSQSFIIDWDSVRELEDGLYVLARQGSWTAYVPTVFIVKEATDDDQA